MNDLSTEEREIISNTKKLPLQKDGDGKKFHVPAIWFTVIPQLNNARFFSAHVERDLDGRIFLIFQKERPTPGGDR
jgi:hypothetical protein